VSSLRYRTPTFVPLNQLRLTDADTRSKPSDHLGETRRIADNDEGTWGSRRGMKHEVAEKGTWRRLERVGSKTSEGYRRWKAEQKGGKRAFGVTRYAGKELKIRAGWKALPSENWPGKKGR
jgi:hypothetical protein